MERDFFIIHKEKTVDKKNRTLEHFFTEETMVKLGLQD